MYNTGSPTKDETLKLYKSDDLKVEFYFSWYLNF